MSLINDALKKARQSPTRTTPTSLPPLQPAAEQSSLLPVWLVSALIVLLICAAIFFIGWSCAHHAVHTIAGSPDNVSTQDVAVVPLPLAPPPAAPVVVDNPPDGPVLQGIFYSPTAPSAIVDGKTIRPGDRFKQYKVKEISKYTVTLIDADGKTIKLGMSN